MKNNTPSYNSNMHPDDDLDYLAEAGKQKVSFTPQELKELNIRIQSGGKLSSPNSGIFFSLMVVMITATVVFLMSESSVSTPKKHTATKFSEAAPPRAAHETKKSISASEIITPTVAQYKKEHFLLEKQKNSDKEISLNLEITENIRPIQIQSIYADTGHSIVKASEFSAPVYEIMGYKIANYHRYYFNPKKNLLENQKKGTEFKSQEGWEEPEHANSAVRVLQDALSALRTSNYPEALQQFELLLELNREDENAMFYSGLCCFFNKKYVAAIDFFVKTESNSNKVFLEEARFYRAMALQYSGNESEARILFNEIVNEKKFYSARAAEFLR